MPGEGRPVYTDHGLCPELPEEKMGIKDHKWWHTPTVVLAPGRQKCSRVQEGPVYTASSRPGREDYRVKSVWKERRHGRNFFFKREKGKKTAMQACSAGQEAQLTELLNLLLWRWQLAVECKVWKTHKSCPWWDSSSRLPGRLVLLRAHWSLGPVTVLLVPQSVQLLGIQASCPSLRPPVIRHQHGRSCLGRRPQSLGGHQAQPNRAWFKPFKYLSIWYIPFKYLSVCFKYLITAFKYLAIWSPFVLLPQVIRRPGLQGDFCYPPQFLWFSLSAPGREEKEGLLLGHARPLRDSRCVRTRVQTYHMDIKIKFKQKYTRQ